MSKIIHINKYWTYENKNNIIEIAMIKEIPCKFNDAEYVFLFIFSSLLCETCENLNQFEMIELKLWKPLK